MSHPRESSLLLATHNRPLSTTLSDYADRLYQIEIALETLQQSAGPHSGIVAHVARSVGSAFSIARSAAAVIGSLQLHNRHTAGNQKDSGSRKVANGG